PGAITAYARMEAATATLNPADQARFRPQRSCSKKISAAAMRIERLGDDAYVADARLLYCIHHRGESAERYIFIGADKNGLMLRVPNLLTQLCANMINVNGIVSQINPLLLVDADNQPLICDFFYATSFGDVYLNAGLEHRRRHHENNQEHQHNVHQRRDVDVGKGRLCPSIGCGKRHYRLAPATSAAL